MIVYIYIDSYERKVWLDDHLDLKRVRLLNELLQIESLDKQDYGVYSCLFVDEYGEKKLDFKIDEKLVSGDVSSSSSSSLESRLVNRLADLTIDVNAVADFKNRIKIKCRNQFGKIGLLSRPSRQMTLLFDLYYHLFFFRQNKTHPGEDRELRW